MSNNPLFEHPIESNYKWNRIVWCGKYQQPAQKGSIGEFMLEEQRHSKDGKAALRMERHRFLVAL